MGIFGLESYVEKNCRDAFYEVDIRLLIEKAKNRRPDVPPTLVVDLLSCERFFYGNLDWLCGGQGFDYVQKLQEVISAFENEGVNLIFVRNGAAIERKRGTRVAKKYNAAEQVIKTFETLRNGKFPVNKNVPDKVALKKSELSRNRIDTKAAMPYLYTEHILVNIFHQTVLLSGKDKDSDQLISELASNSSLNVFAILSQDTDFLIYQYPKHVHYLSARHMDFVALHENGEALRTFEYDRMGLARWLGLDFGQLPLFATLKGNDLVLPADLADFQNKQIGHWPKEHVNAHAAIGAVASFIRREKLPSGAKIPRKKLENLAKRIFGDQKTKRRS
jgi:hypothetical protein